MTFYHLQLRFMYFFKKPWGMEPETVRRQHAIIDYLIKDVTTFCKISGAEIRVVEGTFLNA